GVHAFYQCLELKNDQMLVIEGDLEKIRNRLFAENVAALPVSEINHAVAPKQQAPTAIPAINTKSISITSQTASSPVAQTDNLVELTQDYLRKQFSELFKIPSNQIDPQAPLENYGIDSILAINLTNQMEKTFGSLSKTLLFEYLTIHELTEYFIESFPEKLLSLFAADLDSNNTSMSPVESVSTASDSLITDTSVENISESNAKIISGRRFGSVRNSGDLQQSVELQISNMSVAAVRKMSNAEPVAIVGLSGRYPEASNLDEFWYNLRDGKDCITEIPKARWDWQDYFTEDRSKEGHHYSKLGGFIVGVDEFDPKFFNISPREAEVLDPQERLFLQHAWMAVEDAGYTRADLQIPHEQNLPGQVGVYVGVMYGEYQLLGAESSMLGKRMGFASSLADIANRVSYVLNLHGPSLTLDTMCSSSLTAIHLACQDLKSGRTDLAIAGGVNVNIHPNKYLILSSGQYISSTGHCHSFGEGGDGYIPGEGVGAIILKRLSEAERDGDHIYGLIKGTALSHGGKTNGYTVPNLQAQASVVSQALAEANVDPRHVSYIEAHGTGTKLGDPIEIAALSKAFYQNTSDKEFGFCLIGSAKSNIGHCEPAAGIAGLTKVLLQMKHRQIVPSLHSARLNPNIDFEQTPFIVNQSLRSWDQPLVDGQQCPRIAGISSFGAGGSNAHVVLEEYQVSVANEKATSSDNQNSKVIIPLSARTADQLKQKAADLLSFIESRSKESAQIFPPLDLQEMAFTLQAGREAM
ncbi:MAG: polyketide synthase, partial [Moraxellaceae bacterium]